MSIQLIRMAPVSAVPPDAFWFATVIWNEPADMDVTDTVVFPPLDPPAIETTTTSSANTAALVTVKTAAVSAASDAELVVMTPDSLFATVTPVVLLEAWVTADPDPKLPILDPIRAAGL